MFTTTSLRENAATLFSASLVAILLPRPAYGYTDPGSGALILQLLLAAGAGVAFYFRNAISWFTRRKPRQPQGDEAKSSDDTRPGSE